MATISLQAAMPLKKIDGANIPVLSFPEGATLTSKMGEPVYLTGGYITVCGTDPALIVGLLAEDGHNDASAGTHNISVYPLDGVVFELNANTTTAATQIGEDYAIIVASNKMSIDISDTTNTRVVVVGLSSKDTVGDTYGRLEVVFIDKYNQLVGYNI